MPGTGQAQPRASRAGAARRWLHMALRWRSGRSPRCGRSPAPADAHALARRGVAGLVHGEAGSRSSPCGRSSPCSSRRSNLPDLDLHWRSPAVRLNLRQRPAGRASAARPASVNWRRLAWVSSRIDSVWVATITDLSRPCRPGSGPAIKQAKSNSPARLKVQTISPVLPGGTCAPCRARRAPCSGTSSSARRARRVPPRAEHELVQHCPSLRETKRTVSPSRT